MYGSFTNINSNTIKNVFGLQLAGTGLRLVEFDVIHTDVFLNLAPINSR